MTGRVVIVTGANSGIGYETAKYLCEGGNDVVLACRDADKGEAAVRAIKALHPNSLVQFMLLDLASTSSVSAFVKEFSKKKRKLNILINNGGMALNFKDLTRKTTSEGFEVTMATNHLGSFLLTNLLVDLMTATASIMGECRIINVTCGLHDHENNWVSRSCDFLDMENFQLTKEGTFNGLQAYKNSKLCNVLVTYLLAQKLKGSRVTVNAVDPGVVPTSQLSRQASKLSQMFWGCCVHKALRFTHKTRTVKQAASQICNIADNEKYDQVTAKYFRDGVDDRSSVESYDTDLQKEVWKVSCHLTGFRGSTLTDEDLDEISLG